MSTVMVPIRKTHMAAARAYGAAFLAVLLGYILAHLVRTTMFPLDDPYITLHSAQVLHWGSDRNFPGVPALYGVTSAPFLALLYLFLFVFPPLQALDTACWLGVLAYILGLVRLARQYGLKGTEGVTLVSLGLMAAFVPFHLLNGLETPWALAAVIWTLAFSSGERRGWRSAAALSGVAASIRPDLLPFSLFVVVALIYQTYTAEGVLNRVVKDGAVFLVLALLPVTPWAVWYYHATDVPYPLTGLAKHYSSESGSWGWKYKAAIEAQAFVKYLIFCGPLSAALVRIRRHPVTWAILAHICFFLASSYIQFPEGLLWNWFRYPVILTPMMVWAAACGLTVTESVSRRKAARMLKVCAAYALLWFPFVVRFYSEECRYFDGNLRDVVAWCQKNLPGNATVMVHDVGYISYASKFHLIDLVGLKTPEALVLTRHSAKLAGADKWGTVASGLALETNADYLIVLQRWEAMAVVPNELRARGWTVKPLRMNGEYKVYRIAAPLR